VLAPLTLTTLASGWFNVAPIRKYDRRLKDEIEKKKKYPKTKLKSSPF